MTHTLTLTQLALQERVDCKGTTGTHFLGDGTVLYEAVLVDSQYEAFFLKLIELYSPKNAFYSMKIFKSQPSYKENPG